jgi:hypothetical protein
MKEIYIHNNGGQPFKVHIYPDNLKWGLHSA